MTKGPSDWSASRSCPSSGHIAACALTYWDGRFPWGREDVLTRLELSSDVEDRAAASEIQALRKTAFAWMESSAPVDWTSPTVRAGVLTLLAERYPWCDGDVLQRVWTWLSWLGWHDGY
jgi:hypothetical protein